VEVADTTRGHGPRPAEGLVWVNGPHAEVDTSFGNPAVGRVGFSGNSRGYLASRMTLTRFAGHAVSPQFTMNTDNNSIELGWYLDDVRVYTCGHGPMPRSTPRVTGTPAVGGVLTAHPGHWSPRDARLRVHWYADGHRVAGARGPTYTVRDADLGHRISVKVTAAARGRHTSTFSPATTAVTAS
jgi:hypothetical protein